MPSVAPLKALQFEGFPDGVNVEARPSRLELTELAECFNYEIGIRGELKRRAGYTQFDTTLPSTSVRAMFEFQYGTTRRIIAVLATGAIWASTGPSSTFIDQSVTMSLTTTESGWGIGFADANYDVYLTSKGGGSGAHKWDGATSTWSTVAAIPNAKVLVYHNNYLFAANTTANPSRIYFSNQGAVETWTASDYIDVRAGDGEEIHAIVVFGDDLIIFKNTSIWKLTGKSPASFALYKLDDLRGTVAPHGIAQLRGRLYFHDRNTGLWAFDGAGFELVSEKINDWMFSNINYDAAWYSWAHVFEDRLYYSVNTDEGLGGRQLVYYAATGGWTIYAGRPNAVVSSQGVEYFASNFGNVYVLDDASTYYMIPTSSSTKSYARTGWFRVAGPGASARVRRIEVTFRADEDVDLTMRLYADYDEDTEVVEYTTNHPVNGIASLAIDGWGPRLHAFQLEFESTDKPAIIEGFTVFITGNVDLRGLRDG